MPAQADLKTYPDHGSRVIDDISDMCEYWKKNRDKGITPKHIRQAIIMLAQELIDTESGKGVFTDHT